MTRVLFVCLGNICRSPAAEAVTRAMAGRLGMDLGLDSAGTGDWHVGKPPYPPMIAAGAARGYDLSALRARQIGAGDFDRFDLIVVMDDDNLRAVEALRPAGAMTPVHRFLDYATGTGEAEVPDPYFTREFERALDLIETAAAGLLDHLAQNASAVSPKVW